ncbi:bifunctional phosphoribosylaminoimidazolecarboxamide formyltransferase/IMP cyclohydrolase, partial [Bacillus cereus]|nr:bifunctional phosphoribosylaminoimidazolecarboxamide formyltransferase/IMP cyclohydrolase [Bacillus cereus]
ISKYLTGQKCKESPETLTITCKKKQELRYGENPHTKVTFYKAKFAGTSTVAYVEQLHGKELSYNNINDADEAL